MADQENYGALASAITEGAKINPYELDQERLQELKDAQQKAIESLQQRYNQPNWFAIAGALGKPQLGGFGASLASAADVMGQQVERQRAQQLPIAQMKLQMYQTQMLMAQQKKAADEVSAWEKSGKPLTPEFVARINSIAPGSAVAKGLSDQISTQQKSSELALQRIGLARTMGLQPDPADLQFLQKSTAPTSRGEAGMEGLPIQSDTGTTSYPMPTERPGAATPVEPPGKTWEFGKDEAFKFLSADPNSMLAEVLPKEVIERNHLDPSATVEKTKQEFLNWAFGSEEKKATPEKPKLPLNPEEATDATPDTWGFARVPQRATFNEASIAQWKEKEGQALERLKKVNDIGAPEANMQYQQNIKGLLEFAKDSKENRQALNRVVNVLNKNPPLVNALLSAGQEGFHANFNGTSASIGAPIQKFLENFNTPEDQQVAQMLTLAIDNANVLNGKMRGMSTTANIPAAEANLLTAGMLSRNLNLSTLLHSFSQLKNSLDMYSNLYNGYQSLYNRYQDQFNPLTATYQIVNSDWWKNTVKNYKDISERYMKDYNAGLKSSREQGE